MKFQVGDKVRIKPGTRYEGQATGSEYGVVDHFNILHDGNIEYHVVFYFDMMDPRNNMGPLPYPNTVMYGGMVTNRFQANYTNSYREDDIEFYEKEKREAQASKSQVLDFAPLSRLILAIEAKEEIVSVLKQHDHSKQIFEEWGLGEVIEYGRGMTFLFYGPPGTGKTWGAHCIAKCLGKELLIVGSAEIQSSEPGAANRNIKRAFADAKSKSKILFLDECDSLIASRADVGMVLSSEINTLLTEIEKFEGVVILATNRVEELDEALERRIALIIEFPEPNFEQRQGIWGVMLPKKMPIEKDVTAEKLAEHKLTGGQIKNVVLQAARLALSSDSKKVGLKHFESAIARVHKSKSLMGTASRYRNFAMKESFGHGTKVGGQIRKHLNTDIDIKKDINESGPDDKIRAKMP